MLLGVIACAGSAQAGSTADADTARGIRWGECPEFSPAIETAPRRGDLECGVLEVPVDYSEPSGRTIDMAVSRLASDSPQRRRGVLLLNPGGPGQYGLDQPLSVSLRVPQALLDGYDLIGFDPRGTGRSAPVTCGLPQASALALMPSHPVDGAPDVAARLDYVKELAAQCEEHDPDNLSPHLSTANTVRDMDLIREALGARQISFIGWSYGSYLGAAYAEVFEDRTDRVVLDSVVDPALSWQELYRTFGEGGELAFGEFAGWAAAHHDVYGLGATPAEIRQTFFRLAEQFDTEPLPGFDGTTFRWLTFSYLYSPHTFPAIADTWKALLSGAPPTPATTGQPPLEIPADNFYAALNAITCADAEWSDSLSEHQRQVQLNGTRYPLFGAMMANAYACVGWADAPLEPMIEPTGEGPSNILLVQNTKDPATSYHGAVRMHDLLSERSSLVTVDEVGHRVYAYSDNGCASRIVTEFLLGGELPNDQSCAGETRPTARR